MQLVAPDIVAEAAGLSPALCVFGIVLGVLLWLFGWRGHRFWIVLGSTVLAGLHGLSRATDYGSQPLLAGILLAIASGLLALALVRVVAFVAGGIALSLMAQSMGMTWLDPLLCFLAGGMLGLILFRVWTMLLTGLAGSLLATYSGLCLIQRLGKLNAADWADKRQLLLNWVCGVLAVLGLVVQMILEKRRAEKRQSASSEKKQKIKEWDSHKEKEIEAASAPKKSTWWSWVGEVFRKAG
jgi:MFS family permease